MHGMIGSKLEQLAFSVSLDIIRGLKTYAEDSGAGVFTDAQYSEILTAHGGSMVGALGHLEALATKQKLPHELLR